MFEYLALSEIIIFQESSDVSALMSRTRHRDGLQDFSKLSLFMSFLVIQTLLKKADSVVGHCHRVSYPKHPRRYVLLSAFSIHQKTTQTYTRRSVKYEMFELKCTAVLTNETRSKADHAEYQTL